jgi:hypothetical protein
MIMNRSRGSSFEAVIKQHLLRDDTSSPESRLDCIRETQPIEWTRLDALRAATGRGIALLEERRAALMSAAVMGKISLEHASSHGKRFCPAHEERFCSILIIRMAAYGTFHSVLSRFLQRSHDGKVEYVLAFLQRSPGAVRLRRSAAIHRYSFASRVCGVIAKRKRPSLTALSSVASSSPHEGQAPLETRCQSARLPQRRRLEEARAI